MKGGVYRMLTKKERKDSIKVNIYFIVLSVRIIDCHKVIKKKPDTLANFKIC